MGFFGEMTSSTVILYGLALAGTWFAFIRPPMKRNKKLRELQESLRIGDEVVTSSGFYGRVAKMDDDFCIVEFGLDKSVKIPVRRTDIIGRGVSSIKKEDVKKERENG